MKWGCGGGVGERSCWVEKGEGKGQGPDGFLSHARRSGVIEYASLLVAWSEK